MLEARGNFELMRSIKATALAGHSLFSGVHDNFLRCVLLIRTVVCVAINYRSLAGELDDAR